tara:strand:+ start:4553 stop:5194 length:642 start_codon:yes stop_codon:yes gene_type:complete
VLIVLVSYKSAKLKNFKERVDEIKKEKRHSIFKRNTCFNLTVKLLLKKIINTTTFVQLIINKSNIMETVEQMQSRKQVIAHDFLVNNTGVIEQGKIDETVKKIKTETNSYPATGSIASMIFYLKFQVRIKDGSKQFNGDAGGIALPGGGALIGDVYTSDTNRLYNDTVSFQFTSTPVYVSIIFFDKNSNALGSFQAGAVNTAAGVGGGSGKWS